MEDGALAGGPLNIDQAVSEALYAKAIIGSSLQARWSSLTILNARRVMLPDRLVLGLYVKSME